VGPRSGLDRCGKISPVTGFEPRTVQPVASRYTDYATAHTLNVISLKLKSNGQVILDCRHVKKNPNKVHPRTGHEGPEVE
jgi:hypothetical protein